MKFSKNINEVAKLHPDYMGFIFYEKSPRNFEGNIPQLDSDIKKIGVFVDASIEFISEKVNQHKLNLLQLHGNESVKFCKKLKEGLGEIEIVKVFSIKDDFDFNRLSPYENSCDYFLFDTKGKLPGGNGFAFDWRVLENYPFTKPYFLSGGIGIQSIDNLKEFFSTDSSKYCKVIDVNSRFEVEAGLKDVSKVNEFLNQLERNLDNN